MEMEIAAESAMGAWASRLTRELVRAQLEETDEAKAELLSTVVHKALEDLFLDVPESAQARVAVERTAHLLSTFSLAMGSLVQLSATEMGVTPQQIEQSLARVLEGLGGAVSS
jgi:hypothetical protein